MARKYQLKRRAERQEETQQRIVDATVALHSEIGPARTTIKAIADRAGVERLTVYRHFPDEADLFRACGARFTECNPLPDLTLGVAIANPEDRLRKVLAGLYGYYAANEGMLANVQRDAEHIPALQEVLASDTAYFDTLMDVLSVGWDPEDLELLRASIGHSINFWTWRELTRTQSVTTEQAVELMVCLVRAVAGSA
jgi:AcrR family transcriptional regulator